MKKQYPIETLRHSIAHLMAAAILELFPKAKFGIGPVIENGFYYDFDLPRQLTKEGIPGIEKKMKELIKKELDYQKKEISLKEAVILFKKLSQPYKIELLKDLEKFGTTSARGGPASGWKTKEKEGLSGTKNKASIYKTGDFIDLCRGPHIKNTKEINPESFKLTKIAGAYWRGSEKNPMLQRVYGIAFTNKKEMNQHLKLQEEIEKRDHRILGQRLELFMFDEEVGSGLPLWMPKGALVRQIIEDFWVEEHLKNGYGLVRTPHIGNSKLFQRSGHLDFYNEGMYSPINIENEKYYLKPMNCPFHVKIYNAKIRSYRNLPIRFAELGTVYRHERSGVLHGLTRVRGFTQDDAHVICTPEQVAQEIAQLVKYAPRLLKTFGIKDYMIYLSTRPEKYTGTLKNWEKATNNLKYVLKKLGLKYQIDPGGGVFYGPKIDFKINDSLGREWQCTTIQFDFNLPEKFEMTYIDKKGNKKRPFMIHRALLGSMERFIGVLIEYYAGALPLWLSPVQVKLIPVGARHEKYLEQVKKLLRKEKIRVELDTENETVSKKIRAGEIQKIPYLAVAGDKEMKSGSLRIRSTRTKQGKNDLGEIKISKFVEQLKEEIEKKKHS